MKKKAKNTKKTKAVPSTSVRRSLIRYLMFFLGAMFLFYVLYYSAFYNNYLRDGIENFQAGLAGGLLNIFGAEVQVAEGIIRGNSFEINIEGGCDGVESIMMLVLGIALFPIAMKLKWPGLLIGGITLFVLNIIRIAGLYLSGLHAPKFFDFLHLHGGFILFSFVSILIWAFWASWALKRVNWNS